MMSTQDISIKQLPLINEINTGDLILVQTPNATSTLDFNNFVVGLDNTSFAPTISSHGTRITALSTVLDNTFFSPPSIITNAAKLVLSSATGIDETVSVHTGFSKTFQTVSGQPGFSAPDVGGPGVGAAGNGQEGRQSTLGFTTSLSNVAATTTNIQQENIFDVDLAALPITIQNAGVTRVYYMLLSAAGVV